MQKTKKEVKDYVKRCECFRQKILDLIIEEVQEGNADINITMSVLLQLMGDMLLSKDYTQKDVDDFKIAIAKEMLKRFNAWSCNVSIKKGIINEL